MDFAEGTKAPAICYDADAKDKAKETLQSEGFKLAAVADDGSISGDIGYIERTAKDNASNEGTVTAFVLVPYSRKGLKAFSDEETVSRFTEGLELKYSVQMKADKLTYPPKPEGEANGKGRKARRLPT